MTVAVPYIHTRTAYPHPYFTSTPVLYIHTRTVYPHPYRATLAYRASGSPYTASQPTQPRDQIKRRCGLKRTTATIGTALLHALHCKLRWRGGIWEKATLAAQHLQVGPHSAW